MGEGGFRGVTMATLRYAAVLALPLVLPGCSVGAAALAIEVAQAIDAFAKAGSDTIAAVSSACQLWERAKTQNPVGTAPADPWYGPVCSRVAPDNPAIDSTTAAWIAAGAGKAGVAP